mgnify:FL=1
MDYFHYHDGHLHAEDIDIRDIVKAWGTPCYVYSRATLERHWRAFDSALSGRRHLVCYAVKANSNLSVLHILGRLGSGFDIVSGGELERVLLAGGDPGKVVFSGVGKTADEMRIALEQGIRCFNVESYGELELLNKIAAQSGRQAPVSIRVNPDVDAGTHPYISTGLKENKFGIDIETAFDVYRDAADMPYINITGIDCHIGSQLTDSSPLSASLERLLLLVSRLEQNGISIHHIDIGGGLGIPYRPGDRMPSPEEYMHPLLELLGESSYEIIIEPGRAIAGNAGILLTNILYLKETETRNFAIVDSAMNDLLRPALYTAWHDIIPVQQSSGESAKIYDVVGPVCETGDFIGKERRLAIKPGETLAVRSAGAYGFTMSSNYNSRPRPAEILVDGNRIHEIRRRESFDEMLRLEQPIPSLD